MYTAINHIAISVYDINRSADFYKNILQLESIPEPFKTGKYYWFQIGPRCQLHLIRGAAESTTHHIDNHLSFCVQSIEKFISHLESNNIEYGDVRGNKGVFQIRPDGIKQVFFQDPDGRWIEVNNDYLETPAV